VIAALLVGTLVGCKKPSEQSTPDMGKTMMEKMKAKAGGNTGGPGGAPAAGATKGN
jgi:hypothetical protein